jgi:hypothetical protein
MAGSQKFGSLGSEHHDGMIPPGIRGRSFAFPGSVGSDTWFRAAGATLVNKEPPNAQQRAEELVRQFAARPGRGEFKKISRSKVAEGLVVRVYKPSAIHQKVSSLCGPAALVFDLASRDPVAYVKYVISLYEHGKGRIRDIEVVPGSDLKSYDPGENVEASDWIALASLRDSENYFFDYQDATNEFAGITLPGELEAWFRKVGYEEVINEARVIVDQEEENILRANAYFQRGFRVCLFIHSNMLNKSTESSGSVTPDHWVVQTSSVTFGMTVIGGEPKRTIALRIYTWGEGRRRVPQIGVLLLDDFLDNYYGFVAAKY